MAFAIAITHSTLLASGLRNMLTTTSPAPKTQRNGVRKPIIREKEINKMPAKTSR